MGDTNFSVTESTTSIAQRTTRIVNETYYEDAPGVSLPREFDRTMFQGLSQLLSAYNEYFRQGSLCLSIQRYRSDYTYYQVHLTGVRLYDQLPVSVSEKVCLYEQTVRHEINDSKLSALSVDAVRQLLPRLLGTDESCLRDQLKLYSSELDAAACSTALNYLTGDKFGVHRIKRTFLGVDWLSSDLFQVKEK
ncbi:MAG: hypothetical protein HQM16_19025 [Deltaproteobacteria bacterium]|nr:hypothetical protein [Deltaproteobacteria bacterium]